MKHQERFFTKANLDAFKKAVNKVDGFRSFIAKPVLDSCQLYYAVLERFCYFKNFPLVKYLIEELKFNINEHLRNTPLTSSIEYRIEPNGISEPNGII